MLVLMQTVMRCCSPLRMHPRIFHPEIWENRFHRIFGSTKLHRLESSRRNLHLLFLLDQSSVGVCRLPLFCPGSSLSILSFQVKISLQI